MLRRASQTWAGADEVEGRTAGAGQLAGRRHELAGLDRGDPVSCDPCSFEGLRTSICDVALADVGDLMSHDGPEFNGAKHG